MNTTCVLRILMKKTPKLYTRNGSVHTPLQQFGHVRMATNVSVSQSKKEKETFQDLLPYISETIAKSQKYAEVPDVANWKKVLDYNLRGGKYTRGLITVFAYEMMEKPENITEESLRQARIMGWCVELLQAYLLILDDIMDGSTTRRGVPCWYRMPEVGLGAINDSILIYTSIHQTLKKHFHDNRHYSEILDLFNEALMNTSIGQHLDYAMAHRYKTDYSLFTIEQYHAIVKFKTAYYTFTLPCCLGLILANKTDKETHATAESILLEIGKYFQIQDDYIDCFGDESVTGKAGTDIQEGKCTWLAVMALQRCNAEQRAIFEQYYGSKQPEDVQRIKRLYEQLQLPQLYREYERATYDLITQKTQALPDTFGANFTALVMRLLNMLYKRNQ
ncbi:LOW QUALITY PROTEIN: uncharacterized protein ACR2FA_002574 [Aphomia sociella]